MQSQVSFHSYWNKCVIEGVEPWADWKLASLSLVVSSCSSLFICFHELVIIKVVAHDHEPLRGLNEWLFLLWQSSSVKTGRRENLVTRGSSTISRQETSVGFMVLIETSKLHINPTVIFNYDPHGKRPSLHENTMRPIEWTYNISI